MSDVVIHANVVVQWIVHEEQSEAADAVLVRFYEGELTLHVPDLIFVELASVLWKKATRKQLSWKHAMDASALIEQYPFRNYDTRGLFARALEIGRATKRSVYDCTYVALAEHLDSHVITADARFYRAIAETVWRRRVVLIGDVV